MAIHESQEKTNDGRKWYFKVNNGYVIENGKKKYIQYKSMKYKTRKECEKAQANFLLYNSKKKGTPLPMNMLTKKWFDSYKDTVKIQTQQKIQNCLRFVDNYFGEMLITKINEEVYKGFRDSINNYTYYKKGIAHHLKDDQKNKILAYFNKVLEYSFDEYEITYTVPKKYGYFHSADQQPVDDIYYDLDELERLFEATDNFIYKNFFILLAFLGCREGEANGLRFSDYNRSENTISISRTVATKITINNQYLISSPKTKASYRTLLLPQRVKDVIEEMYIYWSKVEDYNDDWYIFGGYKPLAESSMTTQLKKSIKKAGLKDAHLHSLRKSCASLLYNNGVSPLVVQQILGHEDLQTTMKIYTQVYKGKTQEAVDFLDKALKK